MKVDEDSGILQPVENMTAGRIRTGKQGTFSRLIGGGLVSDKYILQGLTALEHNKERVKLLVTQHIDSRLRSNRSWRPGTDSGRPIVAA